MATSFKQVANNAQSTAASGAFNNTTSPLTFSVQTGHGARFPSPGNGFYLTVWNSASYPDPFSDPNMEIVLCTARTTDSLTVTRGQRGTTATAKTGSPDVRLLVDSTHISDLNTSVNTLENAVPAVYTATYTDSLSATGSVYTVTKTINLGVNRAACIVAINDQGTSSSIEGGTNYTGYGGFVLVHSGGAQCVGNMQQRTDTDTGLELSGNAETVNICLSSRSRISLTNYPGGASEAWVEVSLSGSTLTLAFKNNSSTYNHTLSCQVIAVAF